MCSNNHCHPDIFFVTSNFVFRRGEHWVGTTWAWGFLSWKVNCVLHNSCEVFYMMLQTHFCPSDVHISQARHRDWCHEWFVRLYIDALVQRNSYGPERRSSPKQILQRGMIHHKTENSTISISFSWPEPLGLKHARNHLWARRKRINWETQRREEGWDASTPTRGKTLSASEKKRHALCCEE